MEELSKVLWRILKMIALRNGGKTLMHQMGNIFLESCGGGEASGICTLSTQ